jgi:hypothetical protein
MVHGLTVHVHGVYAVKMLTFCLGALPGKGKRRLTLPLQ